jgi:drug/metabolite transporter (DMT)-like permease
MTIALALCSMACAAGNDLVFKQRSGSGTPPGRHLTLVAMVWTACFAVPACATPWVLGDPAIVWGLLAGLLGVAANLLFLVALGGGEVGSVATVYRLNLVPATLLAVVLLGEDLTLQRALAVSAALGAVAALAGPRQGVGWRWLVLAIAACLARAGMGLAYKQGLLMGAGTERLLFVNGAVWLGGSLLWTVLAERRARAWRGSDLSWGLLSGLLISGNVLFLTMALARAPLSDVLPVTQLGFVATALAATLLFGEALTVRKVAALALAVGCIIILGHT